MRRIRMGRRRAIVLALVALVASGGAVAYFGDRTVSGPAAFQSSRSTTSGSAYGSSAAKATSGRATDSVAESQAPSRQLELPGPVPPGTDVVVPGAPQVVRTAQLRVEVVKGGFGAAFDRVASIAASHGGFVASSNTSMSRGTDGDVPSGELTVRIPSDRFDSARQALSGLGVVRGQEIRGEDVSGQLVDHEVRIRSLQAQEEALRTLVGRANAVGEVLQVQSSLFSVRQQIEQLQAQRAGLEQRATLATLSVSLFEPGGPLAEPPETPRTGLSGSLERAVDGAVSVVGGIIVTLGWVSPLLGLGLLAWIVARIARRGRRVPEVAASA